MAVLKLDITTALRMLMDNIKVFMTDDAGALTSQSTVDSLKLDSIEIVDLLLGYESNLADFGYGRIDLCSVDGVLGNGTLTLTAIATYACALTRRLSDSMIDYDVGGKGGRDKGREGEKGEAGDGPGWLAWTILWVLDTISLFF